MMTAAFVFLVPILGCACAIRIFKMLTEQNLFLDSELTKIGTVYLGSMLLLAILLPTSRLTMWLAVFVPFFLLSLFVLWSVHRRSVRFRDSLSESLTLVSLKMRAGRSFRQAFAEVIAESEPRLRAKLSQISSRVVFSQQGTHADARIERDVFISNVIEELTLIDRQPHAATKRLAVFREKIRIENDFRRKSGQVLSRIRAQSLVMSGLYVALAVFIAIKFGWKQNLSLFAISACLFVCGALWIWLGGRNLKWKV